MDNLFLPYQLSLKLKEKDFNEPCFGYWDTEKGNKVILFKAKEWSKRINSKINATTAPTYQQVTDWFRDKYKIQIEMVSMQPDSWLITLQYLDSVTENGVYNGKRIDIDIEELADYYASLNIAIEETLKLI